MYKRRFSWTLICFLFRLRTSRQAFLLLQKWLTRKLKMNWRTTWWRSTSWHHVIIKISSSCLMHFTMRANCGWVDLVYFSWFYIILIAQISFRFSFPQHKLESDFKIISWWLHNTPCFIQEKKRYGEEVGDNPACFIFIFLVDSNHFLPAQWKFKTRLRWTPLPSPASLQYGH